MFRVYLPASEGGAERAEISAEFDVAPGSEMPGLRSNTLHRTFEQITFSSGVTVVRSAGRPAAPVHAPPPPNHP